MASILDSMVVFLSTPSARRATNTPADVYVINRISIHALREEGDVEAAFIVVLGNIISIHALREEGDLKPSGGMAAFM